MIGIVIVAHGGLAAAYLDAMQHVVGAQPGVASVSISEADALAVKRQEIGAAIAAVDAGAGVIVVTDLFGGSPSNLAVAACSRADRRVLYGANMPMLIKLAKSRAMPLDQAVERALRAGRRYIDALQPVLPAAEWMPTARLPIVNEKGLHARASARFVETVERFDADAKVRHDGQCAGGDSIMGLMMLAAACGSEIDVETSGPQAEALLAALTELLASRFGEPR